MTEQPPHSRCQNCDWTGPDTELGRQLDDVPHLLERVEPGEPMPTGECPVCGALCQPIEPELLGRHAWTVSLELPDLCELADFPDDNGTTPLQAVEAFIGAVQGGADNWAYVAIDNATSRKFIVDMAGGPRVQEQRGGE